jgi:acylphosphatase
VNETDIADESWGGLTGGGQGSPDAAAERWDGLTRGGQVGPDAAAERWDGLIGGAQVGSGRADERWDDLVGGAQGDPDHPDERWDDLVGGAQGDPDHPDERWDDLVGVPEGFPDADAAVRSMTAGAPAGAGVSTTQGAATPIGRGATAGEDVGGASTGPGDSAAVDEVRLTAWVQGRVQGVGFRWWVRWNALELGLVGAAENLVDGRVKVIAEGSKGCCVALLERLEGADAPGKVAQVTFRWDQSRGNIAGFTEL